MSNFLVYCVKILYLNLLAMPHTFKFRKEIVRSHNVIAFSGSLDCLEFPPTFILLSDVLLQICFLTVLTVLDILSEFDKLRPNRMC